MGIHFETLKNLIIADDDEDDQSMMKDIIFDYSSMIEITSITDGKKLMEQLSNEDLPDLLLMDLNMPYKTGIQCLTEIRSDKRLKTIPVVIISTSKNRDDIDICFTLGAELFYSKSCDFTSYKELIHSILDIDWKFFVRAKNREEFARIALSEKLNHTLTTI